MSIRHMDGVCVCMSMSMWYFMLFYYAILTLTPNGVAVMELWQSSQDWWTPFTHFFIICDFVFIHCLVFFSAPTALCILYTFALCFKVYWLYLVGILKYAVSFILVKLVAFPLFFRTDCTLYTNWNWFAFPHDRGVFRHTCLTTTLEGRTILTHNFKVCELWFF